MQVLFRVVSQEPVCLPKLSHPFSADCLFRDQFASQHGESRLCIVPLCCAVWAEEDAGPFPHAVDPECPVCVRCRILSQSFVFRYRTLQPNCAFNATASVNRIGTWSRGSPAGMICNLRYINSHHVVTVRNRLALRRVVAPWPTEAPPFQVQVAHLQIMWSVERMGDQILCPSPESTKQWCHWRLCAR